MSNIDLEDFVSYVIEKNQTKKLVIKGSKLSKVQRSLLSKGITCDFSPGAIDTFAYRYPDNVHVSPFEIKVQPNTDFCKKICEVQTTKFHSVNDKLKNTIPGVWRSIK